MTERVELLKKMIMAMTNDEMVELNRWIYECFKNSTEQITWDEAVDEVTAGLKVLNSKPN